MTTTKETADWQENTNYIRLRIDKGKHEHINRVEVMRMIAGR